jgi:DNA replication licensing factor MCM5
MRENDRVAIHEAMEQQTISIAKAGITTILNSRASVLAAANPVFGRYDDLKSVSDNIDLMTTILSRFDLIFIVRDIRNEERDKQIARHVINVHVGAAHDVDGSLEGEMDVHTMRKFVSYVREHCAPRLSPEGVEMLSSQYVIIRNDVR